MPVAIQPVGREHHDRLRTQPADDGASLAMALAAAAALFCYLAAIFALGADNQNH